VITFLLSLSLILRFLHLPVHACVLTRSASRPRIDPSLVTVDFVPVEESADRKKKRLPATRGKDKKNFKRFNKDDGTMPAKYVVSFQQHISSRAYAFRTWRLLMQLQVEVIVRKGRAPLYFTRAGVAYARFSGSTHKMSQEVLEERQKMGRVYHDRMPCTQNPIVVLDWTDVHTDLHAAHIRSSLGNISTFPKDFIGRQKEIETIRQFVLHNLSSTVHSFYFFFFVFPFCGHYFSFSADAGSCFRCDFIRSSNCWKVGPRQVGVLDCVQVIRTLFVSW
jgi:hypothetical protein